MHTRRTRSEVEKEASFLRQTTVVRELSCSLCSLPLYMSTSPRPAAAAVAAAAAAAATAREQEG
jgi:hypothetical protein